MRFTAKHEEWTGYLTREEFSIYEQQVEGRERCRKWMKKYEANLWKLERKARDRMAEVERAMKEAAE